MNYFSSRPLTDKTSYEVNIRCETSRMRKGNERELRQDNKILQVKLSKMKKEMAVLKKENEAKNNTIIDLREEIRSMISGMNETSGTFPLKSEIINQFYEFYNYEVFNFFESLLDKDICLGKAVRIIGTLFNVIEVKVKDYFRKSELQIVETACISEINEKISSVLRKFYQNSWTYIVSKLTLEITKSLEGLFVNYDLEKMESYDTFTEKICKLLVISFLSDPPLTPILNEVTSVKPYSRSKIMLLDGFLKNGGDCFILMPCFYLGDDEKSILIRALAIPCNFSFE